MIEAGGTKGGTVRLGCASLQWLPVPIWGSHSRVDTGVPSLPLKQQPAIPDTGKDRAEHLVREYS